MGPFRSVSFLLSSNRPLLSHLFHRCVLCACNRGYAPTVFGEYSANVVVDDRHISLSVWDTTGQDDFERFPVLAYSQTDVFLLCFTLTTRYSCLLPHFALTQMHLLVMLLHLLAVQWTVSSQDGIQRCDIIALMFRSFLLASPTAL